MKKTNNLHVRTTNEWLRKLDYLVKNNGFTSRSDYIKTMVEANYAIDKSIGDKLFDGLVETAKEGPSNEADPNE